MNTHQSQLRCINYFVTDLVITANPKHDRNKSVQLNFRDLQINSRTEKTKIQAETTEIQKEQTKELWRVSIQVTQNVNSEKNAPYNFSISILGQFLVHPDYPKNKVKKLVSINGCSLLYTTAREILRSSMAYGPFRPIILPTVCFSEADAKVSPPSERTDSTTD